MTLDQVLEAIDNAPPKDGEKIAIAALQAVETVLAINAIKAWLDDEEGWVKDELQAHLEDD